ncbi:hypothetical protein SAY86_031642 [Trapa natans]|uniref:BHLH domain-containing protein n=1 Tax=Trapa natans TaxID=22666 RepID=A0AAN7LT60_TRANT|nr:hypothetical protein SAY86_031642 [Trapa natans]
MGYLLKEALKTLCGVNQWAYAVFWKIDCHNPKLLIWEECYSEPLQCSDPSKVSGLGTPEMSLGEKEECLATHEVLPAGKIQSLIDHMMVKNEIVIMGEGLTGRAAVTGNHQWVLSKFFDGNTYPPQVLNEMHYQFSAGIETVAIIPVSTHGVVQFGSSLSIMENMGFVASVRSLILKLGCIHDSLFSCKCYTDDKASVSPGMHCSIPPGSCKLTRQMVSGQASQPSDLVGNVHDVPPLVFQNSNQPKSCPSKICPVMRASPSFHEQSEISFVGADEILHNPGLLFGSLLSLEGWAILSDNCPQLRANEVVSHELLQASYSVLNDPSKLNSSPCFPLLNAISQSKEDMFDSSKTQEFPLVNMTDHVLSANLSHLPKVEFSKSEGGHILMGDPPSQWLDHFEKQEVGSKSIATSTMYTETSFCQHSMGDDLSDVFGGEHENKILCGFQCPGEKGKEIQTSMTMHEDASDFCAITECLYDDGGIFPGISDDHLLDAVVSRSCAVSKQSLGDNLSCQTTTTKMCCSSALTFHGTDMSPEQIEEEIFRTPKPVENSVSPACHSRWSGEGRFYQPTSFCGSQVSSWLEQNQRSKVETSVSTGCSKRPGEVNRPNRKRLKPGENPRPRPKDRQMIQDRLKELREIVPNGAKCSIDALLERAIKHMLFLNSVTKHADMLKEPGESKIIHKEGGLLLKDNFEGGSTWAFEVGSQSVVCPIIVEDLDPPGQLLVEMLCENRGLVLEIADMIQGFGLTILKGMLESRNDKVWARFSVEANRDLSRKEIFMSLIRLLDQNVKTSETSPMGPLHSFMQPPTVPAMCGPW